MVHLTCPTGCPGEIPHPIRHRDEPVQCPNCRAWLLIPDGVGDEDHVEGVNRDRAAANAEDLETPDPHAVIRVTCPTGCDGEIPRPMHVRQELMRCHNCTAWFRIPDDATVEATVAGLLVADPGQLPDGIDESRVADLTVRPMG